MQASVILLHLTRFNIIMQGNIAVGIHERVKNLVERKRQ